MDKNYSDGIFIFAEQVNAYVQIYNRLPFCKQCPRPQLCVVCLSSIGEALLIEKLKIKNSTDKLPTTKYS